MNVVDFDVEGSWNDVSQLQQLVGIWRVRYNEPFVIGPERYCLEGKRDVVVVMVVVTVVKGMNARRQERCGGGGDSYFLEKSFAL